MEVDRMDVSIKDCLTFISFLHQFRHIHILNCWQGLHSLMAVTLQEDLEISMSHLQQ